MFEISDMNMKEKLGAKIKVIGIGGGGGNAVNTMIRAGLSGVEYIVANTDIQALNASLAQVKIQLGGDITKGLGAGANPEIGRKAALDEYEKMSEILSGSDMVFITAGMGGGTGTGGAPVIAKLAKELGCLTVGVVTKPFLFEGKRRFRQAEEGIAILEESVDSLITIPNQRLLYLAGENLSLVDTFKRADEVLLNAVRGISDLINNTGHINCDFADVSTVMANKGLSLMGTGLCSGPDRAVKAATEAISSPLLEDISIDGATGIIINITGSENLSMHETNEAVTLIMEAADEDAEIIFGTVIDKEMGDEIKVTVIATGLGGHNRQSARKNKAQQLPETNEAEIEIRPMNQEDESPLTTYQKEKSLKSETKKTPIELPKGEVSNRQNLKDSILNASKNYYNQEPQEKKEVGNWTEKENVRAKQEEKNEGISNEFSETTISKRTKSIAERLGFINFDEEELDRPTYLRNEETRSSVERKTLPTNGQ